LVYKEIVTNNRNDMKTVYRIPKAVFIVGKEGSWSLDFPVDPNYGTLFTEEIRNFIEKSNLSPLEKKVKIKEVIDYNHIQKKKDLHKLIAKDLKISVRDVRIYRCRAKKKIDKKLKQFTESLMSFYKNPRMLRSFKSYHVYKDNRVEENEMSFKKVQKQARAQKRKRHKKDKQREEYIIEG